MPVLFSLLSLRSSFRARASLQLEILAPRHQLLILGRANRKQRLELSAADRTLWVWLSRFWPGWRSALLIVKPETVIAWHRKGFRLYWTWKSRVPNRRPAVPQEIRDLIRRMSLANPRWGIEVPQGTVAKCIVRHRKPPSQTWRTFLKNHAKDLTSTDFFVVPTATFRLLFVFVVLSHDRRWAIHFGVTSHPTAEWTAQQLMEAFPWHSAPRYLLRDRDGNYGELFRKAADWMGIHEVLTAPHSPWQNAYVERLIGTIRRECLDHVIVLSEAGLRRALKTYFDYYDRSRTHLALGKDAPAHRAIQPPALGQVIEIPQVGGLHHRYERRAA